MKPLLIIVTGAPCTGKTTLGEKLAREVGLPFINKDGIKEILFDTVGWSDREASRRLGGPSYELLFYFIESQLQGKQSLIAEANFYPDHAMRFQTMQRQYDFALIQIECHAAAEMILERFKVRSESGERHPGHVDHLNYEEIREAILAGKYNLPGIGTPHLIVDTTDFEAIPLALLVEAIEAAKRNANLQDI